MDWRNRSGTHISFGHRGWRGVLTQVLTGSRRVVAPVQGYGTAYYTSGHKYTGEFFEGMMQGNGTYTWLDGIRYVMNSCTRFRSSAISGLLSFEGPSAGPNTGTDTRARVCQPLWPRACHRRRFPVHISLCGSQLCSIRHRLHTHSSTPAPCRWARAEVLSQHRVRWVSISVRAEGIRALRAALCRYEGSFVANRVTGAGRYDWPAERATYEGEVADGCKHGFGRLSFADVPIVYEGQWANGQRHGEVRVLLPLGGAVTCVTRHARGYRRGCSSHPTPFHSTGAEEADAAVRHLCRAS